MIFFSHNICLTFFCNTRILTRLSAINITFNWMPRMSSLRCTTRKYFASNFPGSDGNLNVKVSFLRCSLLAKLLKVSSHGKESISWCASFYTPLVFKIKMNIWKKRDLKKKRRERNDLSVFELQKQERNEINQYLKQPRMRNTNRKHRISIQPRIKIEIAKRSENGKMLKRSAATSEWRSSKDKI